MIYCNNKENFKRNNITYGQNTRIQKYENNQLIVLTNGKVVINIVHNFSYVSSGPEEGCDIVYI